MNTEKIALVTGANRGIGLAVVELLLEHGVSVVLTCREETQGQKAKANLGNPQNCFVFPLDINETASIENVKLFLQERFGKLDILINNAAINYDTWHNTLNADLTQIEQTFQTNTMGAWRVTQALLPLMLKHQNGRIVNVSSGAGTLASQTGHTPGYSLSKLALNGLTLQWANELKHKGILVNAVCPGWVRTQMGGMDATRSPREGAEGIVRAALLADDGPTGKFFRDGEVIAW